MGTRDDYMKDVEAAVDAASVMTGEIAATKGSRLPAFQKAIVVPEELPKLPPEIVEGILRETHKLLLTGPPKANKTWCLINLAVSVATGSWWIDFRCAKRRVLYIDLETDVRSLQKRISTVAMAKGAAASEVRENLDVWPLRGMSCSLAQIAGELFERAKAGEYGMVIIDPAYMVQDGDENNARDIRIFFALLDHICVRLSCTMVISHHHSKGAQGLKSAIDRGSGSGVFGRAPDAVLDMTELVLEGDTLKTARESNKLAEAQNLTGWRMSFTLREFPPKKPLDLWFIFPLHTADSTGVLEGCSPNYGNPSEARRQRNKEETRSKIAALERVCTRLISEKGICYRKEAAKELDISVNTLKDWVEKSPRLELAIDPASTKGTVVLAPSYVDKTRNIAATTGLTGEGAGSDEGVQGVLAID